MNEIETAARWYGVLAAVTWAFAPGVHWLCTGLADRGATIARPLAMLAWVFPAWLLASLGTIAFGTAPLVVTLVVVGGIGWTISIRRGLFASTWVRGLVLVELASLALFAAYLWLRGFTPDILGTEKPMDVALLASSTLTASMPPPDPWFTGQPINYYYLGYLLHGSIGRLAGVSPQFGFNLALATVFSLTAVAAFGAAWNVVRPALGPRLGLLSGAVAAFAVALSGNLYAPLRVLQDSRAAWNAWWWDSAIGIGWRSSRIVCDGPRAGNECRAPSVETINEFPFFSFLLGDLHPHLMALPYTLVILVLAWNLAQKRAESAIGSRWGWLSRVALTGAVAGALYPLNAWDFPTSLLVVGLAVWVAARERLEPWQSFTVLAISALAAWLPFWVRYDPPTSAAAGAGASMLERIPILPGLASAIGLHGGEHTSIGEYLTVFGVPYLFAVLFLTAGSVAPGVSPAPLPRLTIILAAAATLIPGVLLSAPVIPLCGIPLLVALSQLARHRALSPRMAALALFSVAWALSIGVEIFYIRDAFDNRMNTLFKFYYQAWTLYAIATAIAIPLLWSALPRRSSGRVALTGAVSLAILAGLVYPIVASQQWTAGFASWRGLDGLAYGEDTAPDDVAAIRWLQGAAAPGDIVLEAAGCSYLPSNRLPFNRVSAFTGLPGVIGWGGHQRQWRAGQPEQIAAIRQREADVAAMYADPDSPLFASYGVTWLVIGNYETGEWQGECQTTGPYPGTDLTDYPGAGWDEAFRAGGTRIYRRVQP